MKWFIILILIICFIGCDNSVVEPDILLAEATILSWDQEYNKELELYGDVRIVYEIENTGNVDIYNYEIHFTIESETGKGSATKRYDYEIRKEQTRQFTYTHPIGLYSDISFSPVMKIECIINKLNF
jgi:hypothetical protein